MTKVLLVSPPYYKPYSDGQYVADSAPIGLGYVASYALSKLDVDIKLVDYGIEQYSDIKWADLLDEYKPDVVGFNTLTLGFQQVIKMARLSKSLSKAMLVSGGAHSTIKPEELLSVCDVAVQGEGEQTFVEVLQGKRLFDISGICFKFKDMVIHNPERERISDLDSLPFPAYDLMPFDKYKGWGVIGSRGCPFVCDFCESPVLWHRIMKLRSPKNIVDEIELLYRKYSVNHVLFEDDTFNLTPKRGIDICDELINRELGITFAVQMRANKECVSEQLLSKMKQAKCVETLFGVETGSKKVMESMNKNLSIDEASQAIQLAHKSGIKHVKGYFMVGNWNESIKDILKTWRFIIGNPVDTVLTVCTPLPSTEFDRKLRLNGYIDKVDWSKVNWVTPLSRTDKLSQRSIQFMYYLTVIFIHFPAHVFRGGNTKGLFKGIWNFVANKIRGR